MKKFLLPALTIALTASIVSCGSKEEPEEKEGKEKKETEQEACTYEFDIASTDVRWIAYKTEDKVPVEGTFTKVEVVSASAGEDPMAVLQSLSLSAHCTSSNSQDSTRDMKIEKHFFGNMEGDDVTGMVSEINPDGTGVVQITMNNVKNDVPFEYTLEDESVTASFNINILDYKADTAFAALHEACEEKHRGDDPEKESITWEDVRIVVTTTLKKVCE